MSSGDSNAPATPSEPEQLPSLKIVSNDGVVVEISEFAARHSKTLSNLLDFTSTFESMDPIPVGHINGEILEMVVSWCELHQSEELWVDDGVIPLDYEIPEIDHWIADLSHQKLFDLVVGANYLDVAGLMDTACKVIARLGSGTSQENLKSVYGIEEEREVN